MPAIVRYDEQHCPIARALDLIGDRWTLLILRELIISDQRYTDLAAHLPGIAPTLLSQRLRTMTEQGWSPYGSCRHRPHDRSTLSRSRGRDAITVLRALTRFGMPLLEEPGDDVVVRPWTAAHAAVGALLQPLKLPARRALPLCASTARGLHAVVGAGRRECARQAELVLEGTSAPFSTSVRARHFATSHHHRPPHQARFGTSAGQLRADLPTRSHWH